MAVEAGALTVWSQVPDYCLQSHNIDKNHIKVILPTQSEKKSIIVLTISYISFLASPLDDSNCHYLPLLTSKEFNPKAEFFREIFLNSSQSIKFT